MAIMFEEQKNTSGLISVVTWLILIFVLGVATYYIFVKKPDLVPVTAPSNFENTRGLVSIKLKPEEIVDNPQFKALKAYITVKTAETNGKANPFLGF